MKHFPEPIRDAMAASGALVTCVPVRLDAGAWESAVFFQLAGPECKRDRRALTRARGPVAVEIDTDVVEHPGAAVVMLRFEAHTVPDDPLVGEVMLTPGGHADHHETLVLLSAQPRLCWFFADERFRVIKTQEHPLGLEHHRGFDSLRQRAVKYDALVRLTARYDAGAALASVASGYEPRAAGRADGRADRPPPR